MPDVPLRNQKLDTFRRGREELLEQIRVGQTIKHSKALLKRIDALLAPSSSQSKEGD
jgi:hypothetical protein